MRLCTAEDLILHKLAWERTRDLEDLATALERREIERFYRACLAKARGR